MASVKSDMESLLQLTSLKLVPNTEEGNMQLNSFEEIRVSLVEQVNYYHEQNTKMEDMLKKLKVLRNDLDLQCQNELDKLKFSQKKFETKQCTSEAIGLSHAERTRKQNNYLAKVKSCIKIHNNLIEKLSKEIKVGKSELEKSQNKIGDVETISADEIKSLQIKIERYEKELLKFEKKYPWLKDPQYNLQNIAKETEILNILQKEREKLVAEFEVYQGLKPDINEARQQLADMKQKYMSMN